MCILRGLLFKMLTTQLWLNLEEGNGWENNKSMCVPAILLFKGNPPLLQWSYAMQMLLIAPPPGKLWAGCANKLMKSSEAAAPISLHIRRNHSSWKENTHTLFGWDYSSRMRKRDDIWKMKQIIRARETKCKASLGNPNTDCPGSTPIT